jgi:acetyltransferase-like isoleucine patch superfamily enzyme
MINTFYNKLYYYILRLKEKIELSKYDPFTIAEYFRKQGAQIGEQCFIGVVHLGAEPYLIKIGNHVAIGLGVTFHTHDGVSWLFRDEYPSLQTFGSIEIFDNSFIGVKATIMGNVKIGPNAVVGASAVVTKDVPPNTIVGGNPAKVITTVEEYKEKALKLWEQQKPPNYLFDIINGEEYPPLALHKAKLRDYNMLKEHLIKFFWGDKYILNSSGK